MDYYNQLSQLFRPNESPYFAMYTAGLKGIPLEEVSNFLNMIGTDIRRKDVEQWVNGFNRRRPYDPSSTFNPVSRREEIQFIKPDFSLTKLSDLEEFPSDWNPVVNRFFPCSKDNRPLIKWGWSNGYTPSLTDYATAKANSPCGWVGQNMLYQQFIVLDIDGVGHGEVDQQTIDFGNMFKNYTLTFEDPAKPGSFHLYFRTNKLVPLKHFPWAKIDLMGNTRNAAVYFKNKQSNNVKPALLTEEIWSTLMEYQKVRKENNYVCKF